MKRLKVVGVAVGLAAASVSCTPNWATENETGLIMIVSEVAARPAGGAEGRILYSDTSFLFNDDARLIVTLMRKNPGVLTVSQLEGVRLDRYQVQFFRSDGRNVEGVDVPYRITGPLTSDFIEASAGSDFANIEVFLTIVRQQAKLEPPLRNLVGFFAPVERSPFLVGSEGIITTTAEITIYGRQVSTGEVLRSVGRLQVTFADFEDE